MTTAEIISLVLAFGTLISAIAALWAAVHNGNKIQEVHLSLNSRLTQLIESTRLASHAEGREEARKEEQERGNIPQ